MTSPARLVVLVSGIGSNLAALLRACEDPAYGARVVGVVAASGTGKTTFCTRLAAGWRYLTDETLAVDPATLVVLPYPKPLSVVPVVSDETAHAAHPGATYPGKADHAPADLGLAPWSVGDPAPQLAAL